MSPLDVFDGGPSSSFSPGEQLTLLRAALELSEEACVLVDLQSGTFLDCSSVAHQRLGYSREEYLALGPAGLQAAAERNSHWINARLAEVEDRRSGSFQAEHRHRDGHALAVTVHYRVLELQGRNLVLAIHRDRSALVASEARSARLQRLLLEAEQLTLMGSWELIHATGELIWTAGVHQIFATDPEQFKPSYEGFLSIVHPDDRQRVDDAYWQSVTTRTPYQLTHRLLLGDGRRKVVEERGSTSYDANGTPLRSIGTVQDISLLAAYEERLEQAAYGDPLTGLPNRLAAVQQLERLNAAQPHTAAVGVFCLDLDQFQAFNMCFGPEQGDLLLQAVAAGLRRCLPADAFAARLGEDTFVVLQACAAADLQRRAGQLQQLLLLELQQAAGAGQPLPLRPGVTVGACHLPTHGRSAHTLLQLAGSALMEARASGAGGIGIYDTAMGDRIQRRVVVESELEGAIADQRLHLTVQPQVDRQRRLVGLEVLLRCNDRQGRAITPAQFIPVAERSGQIHQLGQWVIEGSCRLLQRWLQQGAAVPPLAINISAVQFNRPQGELLESLSRCVAAHGLSAGHFELEITETALVHDPISSSQEAQRLQSAGFRLAIDDFGTGYASLVSLHHLPVQKIKIDGGFVARLTESARDRAIVRSTITLAHDLGLIALAEGVETEAQWELLQAMGCDQYQGFLFSAPLPAADLDWRSIVAAVSGGPVGAGQG